LWPKIDETLVEVDDEVTSENDEELIVMFVPAMLAPQTAKLNKAKVDATARLCVHP
jgi:hypothetical protein